MVNPLGLYNTNVKNYNSFKDGRKQESLAENSFAGISLTFQGNMIQKTSEVLTKSKKGFWATLVAILGFAAKKEVDSTEKEVLVKKEILTPRILEYTDAELDGILFWERTNNERFTQLRDILRHKEGHKEKDSLKKEEVLLLADYLKGKSKILTTYLKTHSDCKPRELIELQRLEKRASEYYIKVAKFCPYANADEYEIIAKNFSDLWPRERQAVSSYSRQRELIKLMKEMQEAKPKDFQLKIYFSEYLFTFPQEKREQLKKISLETTNAQDLPTTSLDELIARLQYLKTPEGKTEHLR